MDRLRLQGRNVKSLEMLGDVGRCLEGSSEGLLRLQDREGEDPRHALAFVQMHEGDQSLSLRMCLDAKGADKAEQDRWAPGA